MISNIFFITLQFSLLANARHLPNKVCHLFSLNCAIVVLIKLLEAFIKATFIEWASHIFHHFLN